MAATPLIPVILCGGTGTRLWPLSRASYPKQYWPLSGDGEATLLQQTQQRLNGLEALAAPLLLCNEDHRFIVAEQMRQIGVEPNAILLEPRDLLFIDEIHRLSRVAEELLYPAMEDRRLDLTVGKGSTARTRSLDLPPFTLVGATTRAGSLSSPLRDRFGLIQRLEFYGQGDLEAIVERTAGLIGVTLTPEARSSIAASCRGTPRIANRLLRRQGQYQAQKKHHEPIHAASAR